MQNSLSAFRVCAAGQRVKNALMRLIILAFFALALAGCSTANRGDLVAVSNIPSPDQLYVCPVFGESFQDFQDTTGYIQHIDLRRAKEERAYPGNVCILPVGTDVAAFWTSPTNLSVRLRFETRREIPAPTNVADVTITFSDMTE